MSWAAHELENFYLLRHLGLRVSYLGLLLGALAPDFLTKFYAYGFRLGGWYFRADNPAQFHRGWPGMGFTTSIMAGLLFAAFIYLISRRNRAWFIGVFVGYSAHAITDAVDSAGTMLFWPFYNENISIGMWEYAAGEGKLGDAIAYYGSLGFAMDAFWAAIVVLFAWRVLSADYFTAVVRPADPAWGWLERRLHVPDRALLALYRAFFFYGVCRIIAWTIWVHVVERAPWDLSWGGPWWVVPFEPW
ncbi:MAG: metal-dependent hydrolase [Dehalococcoidia bacterium]